MKNVKCELDGSFDYHYNNIKLDVTQEKFIYLFILTDIG